MVVVGFVRSDGEGPARLLAGRCQAERNVGASPDVASSPTLRDRFARSERGGQPTVKAQPTCAGRRGHRRRLSGEAKCFGFVQSQDGWPRRRLVATLQAQGLRSCPKLAFLSDGEDSIRS